MTHLEAELQAALAGRRQGYLWRERQSLQGPQQPEITIGKRRLLSFCSNDYLGLANHPAVVGAYQDGLKHYGAGSGASHLVTGHSDAHEELEQALAQFTGRDRALLFSSGYMANIGVLTTLLGKGDRVLEDRLNHASLLDGGLFSGARFQRYRHQDMKDLGNRLRAASDSGRTLVVSDGVFSMDGDVAPLADVCALAESHRALVMVDDAHGFGCLGPQGTGLIGQLQAQGANISQDNCQILVGTLGKAFGTSGAFVAGSEALIETLIQFCRPYIYTTAMPAASAAATLASLELVKSEDWRRQWLQDMIGSFRARCTELGLQLSDSLTPIQAIILGTPQRALAASEKLADAGLQVSAIRPPTVPAGSARLRITFSAAHSQEHLDYLLQALESIAELQA